MNQEVAELERQFSAIKTPGAMRSFLFGDPKANPSTLRGRIAKKGGLDYYLGFMSDKSEDYSRRVAMYFGRRVAKAQGINDVESQLSFAHNFANRSEEHTSELQSLMRISYAVFCFKKKKNETPTPSRQHIQCISQHYYPVIITKIT